MEEMSVSDFRQKCLALMDQLPADGIVLTRHGQPVARVVPVRAPSCGSLIGTVSILNDLSDDLFTTGEPWDAES